MSEMGPSLITSYTFKGGKEYVVKMKVTAFKGPQRNLELTITDKYTAEDWQSSYDAAYIENLTQKTGNYKHFDVFVAMLKSGFLKTSESISLDLLTFEDLESLRARRVDGVRAGLTNAKSNRRYLILTYTVEFDRIHYPLALEYCGLPDPIILQATIRRLQSDIERLQSSGINKDLQKRIQELITANQRLVQENLKLSNPGNSLKHLLGSIKTLESNVAKERISFQSQIQKLRTENVTLKQRVKQLIASASRKPGDGSPMLKRHRRPVSAESRLSYNRRNRSRSSSSSRRAKSSIASSGSPIETFRTHRSPCRNAKSYNQIGSKDSKIDLANLESRIQILQRMLKEGINLN